ncbi:hypothetical protein ACWCPF_43005 [Streptomyces sp. NPDC001858]
MVNELPVGVERLRQDRILEEALANGADPSTTHTSSPSAKVSIRYTSTVTETEVEGTPNPS